MVSEKAKLYGKVDSIRRNFRLPIQGTIWTVNLLRLYPDFDIQFTNFTTQGFCGIAMVGKKIDTIVLNMKRNFLEQNFDCSHELMHLCLHRNNGQEFSCFTQTKPSQSRFLEWQANEGAAQWLIPYQDFIPRFSSYIDQPNDISSCTILEDLANHYHTTTQVIKNRINSLNYAIDQYRTGVPISEITILSKSQLDKMGIHPTDYNALCAFSLPWNAIIG